MEPSRTPRAKTTANRRGKRERITDHNRCCCLHDGFDLFCDNEADEEPLPTEDEIYGRLIQLKELYAKQIEIINNPGLMDDTKTKNGRPRINPLAASHLSSSNHLNGQQKKENETVYLRQHDFLDDYLKGSKISNKPLKAKANVPKEAAKSKLPPPQVQPQQQTHAANTVTSPITQNQNQSQGQNAVSLNTPVHTPRSAAAPANSDSDYTPMKTEERKNTSTPTLKQASSRSIEKGSAERPQAPPSGKKGGTKLEIDLQSLIGSVVNQLDTPTTEEVYEHLTKNSSRRIKADLAQLPKETIKEVINASLSSRTSAKTDSDSNDAPLQRGSSTRRSSTSRASQPSATPTRQRPDSSGKRGGVSTEHIAEDKCPVCKRQYQKDEKASEDDKAWICCDMCDRWVHASCDHVYDVKLYDDATPNHLQYYCPICRKSNNRLPSPRRDQAAFRAKQSRAAKKKIKPTPQRRSKRQKHNMDDDDDDEDEDGITDGDDEKIDD